MRYLFYLLGLLVLAVGVGLGAHNDPGYVLINYGQWSVESSLTLLVVALVVGFLLLYAAIRLVVASYALPRRLRAWRRERRAVRAQRSTVRGMTLLAEGQWQKAERELTRQVDKSETPLLNYLAAARAAQEQDEETRRDHYLSMAHRVVPGAELAIGVTQAELQMVGGQLEQALATVMHLHSVAPKNAHVLQLLQQLYERLGSWNDLLALLPELRKRKVLEESAADQLERQAFGVLLTGAQQTGKLKQLHALWERVPRALRQQPSLLGVYVQGLSALKGGDEAEELLREAIRREWDAELVRLYGLVESKNATQQLNTAEEWLKRHERHAILLLTLGRLAVRAELWGKARSYLEASVGMEARPETYRVLAELLERLGEEEASRDYYRKGLVAATGEGKAGPVVPLRRFPLANRANK